MGKLKNIEERKGVKKKKIEAPMENRLETPIKERGKFGKGVIIFIIILIGASVYFAYDSFQSHISEQETEAFNLGAQYGYESGLQEIFDQAVICKFVKLTDENLTVNLIDPRCSLNP